MRKFNAIKNTVNFGKGKNTMSKFKVHDNDVADACDLSKRLHAKGWKCWFSINENDISDCKWWIADADTDAIDAPIQYGGIGALRNHLRTACYKSGALQRPRHIASRRNHIRLSSDVNGKCWTTSNGG